MEMLALTVYLRLVAILTYTMLRRCFFCVCFWFLRVLLFAVQVLSDSARFSESKQKHHIAYCDTHAQ